MTMRTVTATYKDPTGNPLSGRVSFQLAVIASDGTATIYGAAPITVTLNGSGSFSISLVTTDSLTVANLAYQVTEVLAGQRANRFYMTLVAGGGPVDLATVTRLTNVVLYDYATNSGVTSAIAVHSAVTTAVHGIADTSKLALTGAAFYDISTYAGVDNTGVTECAAAINTALTDITSKGGRAYAKGTFKTGSTITIACNAEMGDATFNYTAGSGTAVVIGTPVSGGEVDRLDVVAPRTICTAKTVVGWAQVAGTVGISLTNLLSSRVFIPYVQNFETNLRGYGYGNGCAYNDIHIGQLDNGKINLKLTASSGPNGWCNENNWYGGRMSQNGNEGTNTSGVRHIELDVCPSAVNNNMFYKPSVEGDTPEYHLSIAGSFNMFIHPRLEATIPKVRWNSDSSNNCILQTPGTLSQVTETFVAGAAGTNDIDGTLRRYFTRAGDQYAALILENTTGSNSPTDVVMPAGSRVAQANTSTAWTTARSAATTKWKATGDSYERARMDHATGRLNFGDGTAAPVAWIGPSGLTSIIFNGSGLTSLLFPANQVDIGAGSSRPRHLNSSGYLDLQEQGSDPAPPSANGARIYLRDNGSGKTQLCVLFNTGAVQVIATQP